MVVAENSSGGDGASIPVADVVFVVEGTANLGAYIDTIKHSYILPTLEYFNGGPPDSTDYGCDYNCTLYDLITFYSGDIAPGPAATCTEPTTSTHDVITWMDSMPFIGGCGEYYSHMAEGLSTALQVFDDISTLRKHSQASQKHCILVCNSSPYMLPAQESLRYSGMTCEQIVSTMTKRGVNFTIISPRKIPTLQRLFEEAYSSELGVTPVKDFSTDPRHLVLLHGYQLQERSMSPGLEDDKQTTDMLKATISAAHSPAASGASKVHSPAAAVLPSDEQGKFKVPATVPSTVGTQSSLSQPSTYSQQPSPIQSQPSPVGGQQPSSQQNQPITSNLQMPISHPQVSPIPTTGLSNISSVPSSEFQQSSPQDPFSKSNVRMPAAQSRLQPSPQSDMIHPQGVPMGPRPSSQQNIGIQNRPQNPNQMPQAPSQAPSQQQSTPVSQQQIPSMQDNSMASTSNPMGPKTLPIYSQSTTHPASTAVPQSIPQQPRQPQQPGGGLASNPFPNQQTSLPMVNPGDVSAPQDIGGAGDLLNSGVPTSQQTLAQLRQRKVIWQGHVEWQEKPRAQTSSAMNQQRVQKALACSVTIGPTDPEINARNWPNRLLMQLIPQHLLRQLEHLFKNARHVAFHFANSDLDALKNLYRVMGTGFAGCVHFQSSSQCDVKVLLLVFSNKKRAFIGLIPNDQSAFVLGIRQVITQHKNKIQQPPMGSIPNAGMPSSTATSTMGMSAPEASNTLNLPGKQISMPPSSDQTSQMSSNQLQRPHLTTGQISMGGAGGQQLLGQQASRQQQQHQQQQQQISLGQLSNATALAASGAAATGPNAHQQEQERLDNLQRIKELRESLQRAQEKELVFRQSDTIEPTPTSQPPHQVMGQQAPPRQMTAQQQQQHQLQQQQRLQLQQQQQSSNQQQLRHLLLSQQQQQLHARQLLLQQQQQQQQRGPGPQSQHGMVSQHQLVPNQMSNMAPQQGGQNFIDEFNLPDM